LPTPRNKEAAKTIQTPGWGIAKTSPNAAARTLPSTIICSAFHRDMSHRVISSPMTAPTNRAAVAAPPIPANPDCSDKAGATGRSTEKLTERHATAKSRLRVGSDDFRLRSEWVKPERLRDRRSYVRELGRR